MARERLSDSLSPKILHDNGLRRMGDAIASVRKEITLRRKEGRSSAIDYDSLYVKGGIGKLRDAAGAFENADLFFSRKGKQQQAKTSRRLAQECRRCADELGTDKGYESAGRIMQELEGKAHSRSAVTELLRGGHLATDDRHSTDSFQHDVAMARRGERPRAHLESAIRRVGEFAQANRDDPQLHRLAIDAIRELSDAKDKLAHRK